MPVGGDCSVVNFNSCKLEAFQNWKLWIYFDESLKQNIRPRLWQLADRRIRIRTDNQDGDYKARQHRRWLFLYLEGAIQHQKPSVLRDHGSIKNVSVVAEASIELFISLQVLLCSSVGIQAVGAHVFHPVTRHSYGIAQA